MVMLFVGIVLVVMIFVVNVLIVFMGIELQVFVDVVNGGDVFVVYEVGNCIFDGCGVVVDLVLFFVWYLKVVLMGFVLVEYCFGSFYEKGVGVSVDLVKVVEYYLMVVKVGNISVMYNFVVFFVMGMFGVLDFGFVVKWFIEVVNYGVCDSQFNFVIFYVKGSGVVQDFVQFYKWFGIVVKDGDIDVVQKCDEVGKVFFFDQLIKVKVEVDGWKVVMVDDKVNVMIIFDVWVGKVQKINSVDMKKVIIYIQVMLNKNGFDVGKLDGVMGVKMVVVIKQFQFFVGQQVMGEINDVFVKELIVCSK